MDDTLWARDEIFILGYTSSADCKLISSVGVEGIKTCIVQATLDGMGLTIFSLTAWVGLYIYGHLVYWSMVYYFYIEKIVLFMKFTPEVKRPI